MNKLSNYFLTLFMSAFVIFVTSCGDDSEDILSPSSATISFQNDAVDFSDTTVAQGTSLVFDLAIDLDDEEGADLNVVDDLGSTILTTTLNGNPPGGTVQVTYQVPTDQTGDIVVTATLTDPDDNSTLADADLTVTVESSVAITTIDAFLLAAPTAETTSESFYSIETETLYSYDDVVSTSANLSETIDFGYAYGASENATINAPSEYPSYIGYDMSRWGTLRETEFRTPSNITVEEFDALTDAQGSSIVNAFEVGGDAITNRVLNLEANQLIAFKTADDRFGVIKVVEVVGTTGSNDGIRIEIKLADDVG